MRFAFCFTVSPCNVCIFVLCCKRFTSSAVKKNKLTNLSQAYLCTEEGNTKAAPGKTHPPGKPSRPSKRICICGKWQRLLYTHTLLHTQIERQRSLDISRNVFFCKHAGTLKAKVYITHRTCTCARSLTHSVLSLTSIICLMGIFPNSWLSVSE